MDFGSKIYYFFPFSSFCEWLCVCFCVRFCLYNFAFTICPRILSDRFFLFLFLVFFNFKIFFLFSLIIIFSFFILITLFYFILLYFILSYFLFFFLFFLPFILSCVDERLLVLQPDIRAVPLRWESQLQDTGPQETSQLHVIPNDENLPEISISTPRPNFTQRPARYSAGHPMPNN